ncbi:DUF4312 family protein [Vibrio sp.]|uniref:DUF4312 family protein n=1 Tax=Vibrio sp. TaxID=678 RepID=UPI003AA7E159
MKESRTSTVRVQGSGKTKNDAMSHALSKIQKTILKDSKKIILRIEPIDIEIIQSTYNEVTEKFMFLFLPRVKTTYFLTLDVTVDITLFDLDDVEFSPK